MKISCREISFAGETFLDLGRRARSRMAEWLVTAERPGARHHPAGKPAVVFAGQEALRAWLAGPGRALPGAVLGRK